MNRKIICEIIIQGMGFLCAKLVDRSGHASQGPPAVTPLCLPWTGRPSRLCSVSQPAGVSGTTSRAGVPRTWGRPSQYPAQRCSATFTANQVLSFMGSHMEGSAAAGLHEAGPPGLSGLESRRTRREGPAGDLDGITRPQRLHFVLGRCYG